LVFDGGEGIRALPTGESPLQVVGHCVAPIRHRIQRRDVRDLKTQNRSNADRVIGPNDGVDPFVVERHERHHVLHGRDGRNGVGKTTLVRSIIGFAPPRQGRITFKGEEIAGRVPQRIARLGIGLVPQGRRMFPSLTTRETLEVGRIVSRWDKKRRGWTIEQAFAAFPRLRERADQPTGRLSGGEQQMAATARALVGYPDLLLLDEPTEGLAPLLVEQTEAIPPQAGRHCHPVGGTARACGAPPSGHRDRHEQGPHRFSRHA
jgi:ABC-type ATPase involved in cell division